MNIPNLQSPKEKCLRVALCPNSPDPSQSLSFQNSHPHFSPLLHIRTSLPPFLSLSCSILFLFFLPLTSSSSLLSSLLFSWYVIASIAPLYRAASNQSSSTVTYFPRHLCQTYPCRHPLLVTLILPFFNSLKSSQWLPTVSTALTSEGITTRALSSSP